MKTEDILSKCNICGIASDEVRFAKELLSGKGAAAKEDKESFICEGLWAAEKLMEKNMQITHFFISSDATANPVPPSRQPRSRFPLESCATLLFIQYQSE